MRYADPQQREVADILDSARLDSGQRWLKDEGEMERIAGRLAVWIRRGEGWASG